MYISIPIQVSATYCCSFHFHKTSQSKQKLFTYGSLKGTVAITEQRGKEGKTRYLGKVNGVL